MDRLVGYSRRWLMISWSANEKELTEVGQVLFSKREDSGLTANGRGACVRRLFVMAIHVRV